MFGDLDLSGLIPQIVSSLGSSVGGPVGAILGNNPNANGAGLSVDPAQASRDLAMPLMDQYSASVLPASTGLSGKEFPTAIDRNNFQAPTLFGQPLDFAGAAQQQQQQRPPRGQRPPPPQQGGAKTEFGDLLLQMFGGV